VYEDKEKVESALICRLQSRRVSDRRPLLVLSAHLLTRVQMKGR